ncbi:cob(I)yrinic acid a,c-diamide adenosyltransferase [bacterium]|nr:cob(I)yrinic acid a,c-diamide adenosyltransferase [bacterium]
MEEMMEERGYVQVYTGNGKGKTTASFGLALRAAGAGKRVFIGQFVKGMHYSELDIVPKLETIEIRQYGRDCFIKKEPSESDIRCAKEGLAEMAEILKSGKYDVVIMDEANIALFYKLFSFEELKQAICNRAEGVEVIVTGRYAPQELIDMADLVTEMREIKHYYTKGVEARVGIEK